MFIIAALAAQLQGARAKNAVNYGLILA